MSLNFAGRSEKDLISFIEDREKIIRNYYDVAKRFQHIERECIYYVNTQMRSIPVPSFGDAYNNIRSSIGFHTIEIMDAKEELSKRISDDHCM